MKSSLPAITAGGLNARAQFEVPQAAMARWNTSLHAASKDEAATINVFDVIGADPWTGEGFTDKKCAAILRNLGGRDVTVNINSPGGSMFEGIAIYNMLREYEGAVTVKVMGMAASAASIIAMAGDTVEIGRAAFLMIHNCWIVAIGNANDLRAAADTCAPFDSAMADVYAARTGIDAKKIAMMIDAETWISGKDAIDQGFADAYLPADEIKEDEAKASLHAVRAMDVALAKAGIPRSERRRLFQEIKGTPDATQDGTQDAADAASAAQLLAQLARFEALAKT